MRVIVILAHLVCIVLLKACSHPLANVMLVTIVLVAISSKAHPIDYVLLAITVQSLHLSHFLVHPALSLRSFL